MTSNADMIRLWNSDASSAWSTRPERYDQMLEPLGRRVLAAAALQPGERVLDVGCGAGQLSLQAAEAVGPTGSVLGVDVAAGLLAVARSRGSGVPQAQFLQADAQEHDLGKGAFDAVVSRFGVMFFADPVAAFGNLAHATRPGGRLAFVAWQPAVVNEWATVPITAAVPHTGLPSLPPPGAPGPFAFGDPEVVRGVLTDAGWADLQVEDVQTTLWVGGARTAEEAVDHMTADTFGRMLLDGAEPSARAAALDALHAAYAERVGPDGVHLGGAVWVVTARRPQA
ncbi:MAG: class I SAM-dependent methyltransferase [Mycobacteriales bacterium]